MEGTKEDLFKHFDNLRSWNKDILVDIKKFQSLGKHTDDVDMRMRTELKIAKRAKQEVFTPWKTFRFKRLRAHPKMLESMVDLGNEYSHYVSEAGKAWKQSDSQRIRDEEPALFRKREDIEGDIRDGLISMVELRPLSKEYAKRYGAHENIVSDRAFQWVTFIGGTAAGALATIAAEVILKAIGVGN